MAIDSSSFPLYKDDGKPGIHLSSQQRRGLLVLKKKIAEGELRMIENVCLCGNHEGGQDVTVSEKDRYGLPVSQLLCKKCGLIRSALVFDKESNVTFYQHYYRALYTTNNPTDRFFEEQVLTGKRFLKLLQKYVPISEIESVAEVGCGAGGILFPFFQAGMCVDGYDFDESYLDYGRSQGLSLLWGDFYDLAEEESVDLVILSHVLEHFLDPKEDIVRILRKIRLGKYLLVEVPGVFNIHNDYSLVLDYFQNAHVYDFHRDYLIHFFKSVGLEVVYSDEKCTFICRKISNAEITSMQCDPSAAERVVEYLIKTKHSYWKWKCMSFYRTARHFAAVVAIWLGWKKVID